MKIKRVFSQTTGFDYVMKAFIESKLEELIDEETEKQYNEDTTQTTPRNEVTLWQKKLQDTNVYQLL